MPASASIDNLDTTWRSLVELCESLTDEQWMCPTGCPGWSVQDQVSHLIDYESRALGRPAPAEHSLSRPHTKNALGEGNEVGVELRRGRTGAEVLAELREVTAARLAQLTALTADDLAREIVTPAGPGTVADMLRLRVMDTWSHEQDIRRAVGQPGHDEGPVVDEAVAYFAQFLPIVIVKRAGATDGSIAVMQIGTGYRSTVAVEGGRGSVVDDSSAEPTVRMTMPATTFAALVGGRSDAPDDVRIEGDTELGERIIASLGFMP